MAYLKSRWKGIVLGLVFILVFETVFLLYQVPKYAVSYGTVLCLFASTLFVAIDAGSFYRKHRYLRSLQNEITLNTDHLPMPSDLLESDYQALIRTLYREKQAIMAADDDRYMDMAEYYTLWAHQIKTPIAAMRLTLQSEDTSASMELGAELQRIEQYVEMALCYLRLDADATDYVIRSYDLDDILHQAVRKYASQFVRKKLRLEYEPVNCQVLTDEKWLLFVIEQILSNALKYTNSGCISITLEPEKILCIRDTGIGIAPEDLPRVCEKGFTGYNGRTDKRASGIGLYLSRRILKNLGHRMTLESRLGVGTTVRIDLSSRRLEVE